MFSSAIDAEGNSKKESLRRDSTNYLSYAEGMRQLVTLQLFVLTYEDNIRFELLDCVHACESMIFWSMMKEKLVTD